MSSRLLAPALRIQRWHYGCTWILCRHGMQGKKRSSREDPYVSKSVVRGKTFAWQGATMA